MSQKKRKEKLHRRAVREERKKLKSNEKKETRFVSQSSPASEANK